MYSGKFTLGLCLFICKMDVKIDLPLRVLVKITLNDIGELCVTVLVGSEGAEKFISTYK